VVKRVSAWVDELACMFGRGDPLATFPMNVKPFLEGPAADLWRIRATAERRRRYFRELEQALKGNHPRNKRGLFDAGGLILGLRFGTATTVELKTVHSNPSTKKGWK
jgi:hypothetical protein